MGAPGDDQGAAGRGRPGWARRSCGGSSRSSIRPSWRPRRSTTCAARRCAWRSTSASAARSSPRSSAGAAASATWSSRCSCCRSCTGGATPSCARRTRSPPCGRSRIEGYVADADAEALADAYRFLRRVEHRLQIVRDLQTHDLPPDRARAHHPGALAGPGRRRRARRASTSARPGSCARSTSGCSTGRCWKRSPDRRRWPGRHGTDRAATEELLGGLGFAEPARSYDVLRPPRRSRPPDRQGARATCSR